MPGACFHVEHVVARQHDGADDLENLALACPFCNLSKGPNLSGIDSLTGTLVRLFDPRQDRWDDHFSWAGAELLSHTPIGRATIAVLAINDSEFLDIRQELLDEDASLFD